MSAKMILATIALVVLPSLVFGLQPTARNPQGLHKASQTIAVHQDRVVAPSVLAADTAVGKDAQNLSIYFGVWRTNIPGAVWSSPSGYRGYDWLHVSAGVSAGDLIIRPDGTYVWASYGGKAGAWFASGDAEYPIVLVDTVENRQWKVGLDAKAPGGQKIYVWDGNYYYYSGRR